MTATVIRRIILAMKRISTVHNGVIKRILINIPFVLIVLLIAACFAAALLLAIYTVVTGIAFGSAMICLILLGCALLLTGGGLLLILVFKRYYAFYDKRMGWVYPDRQTSEPQTKTYKKTWRDIFSVQNVSLGFVAVGAVCVIASAALGCITPSKWQDAISPYMVRRGLYSQSQVLDYRMLIPSSTSGDPLHTLELDLFEKEAVIIYNTDEDKKDYVVVEGFVEWNGQLEFSRTDDKMRIAEQRRSPAEGKSGVDKMLFFLEDLAYKRPAKMQLKIYIPEFYRQLITIEGEHIVAKN